MKRNAKDPRLSWTSYSWEFSREETVEMFRDRAKVETASFAEHLAIIEMEVIRTNPLSLLSSFSTYFLTSLSPSKEIDEGVTMLQAHGEIMQAMLLRHQWDDFTLADHPSNVLHRVGLSVDAVMQAFSTRRLGEMSLTDSKEEAARKQVIAFVRANTQANRNWGYSYQTFRVLREVFAPLEAAMRRACGASASDILDFWSGITKRIEDRMNFIMTAVADMREENSLLEIPQRLGRQLALPQEQIDALCETVRQNAQGPDALSAAVFICLDHVLPLVHICSWDDLRALCPSAVSDEQLSGLLKRWSYAFGDLAQTNAEDYFLDNPIWDRPLIKLSNQTWYLAFPSLFFSFGWDLLGDVLRTDDHGYRRYLKRRGAYLEDALATELQRAFPMATVYRSNFWTDLASATEYENDLMVQIETVLIVIEAKAGMLHESARRGGQDRLKQTIRDLIVAPAIQARRLEYYLKQHQGTVHFRGKDGTQRALDMREIKDVLCWSMTLDLAADLSAIQSTLANTGWVPPDVSLPPSMSLSDLQNVFALLDGVSLKLHYLQRRANFEQAAQYIGDELDLLALYMDRLFALGPTERDGTRIVAYGAGQIFDQYFLELEQGRNPKKPEPRLSRWWKNILAAIEERLPTHWSQSILALLSLSPEDQEQFGEHMMTVRQNVLMRKEPLEDTVTFISGAPHHRVPVIGVAYICQTREERNEQLSRAASQVRLPDGTKPACVLAIGCDPRIKGVPYSVLAMLYFEDETPNSMAQSRN